MVCPLNWGIGHASRMVPLIHALHQAGYQVIVGSDGKALILLQTTFPGLEFLEMPALNIRYSRRRSQAWIMMLQVPVLLTAIIKDHFWIKREMAKRPVDVIISDNRYGLFHKKALSILVTHQISLTMPEGFAWIQPLVSLLIQRFTGNFNRCWVPDTGASGLNLSGKLSHPNPLSQKVRYMGILSRFNRFRDESLPGPGKAFDILVILSGPEPQRTLFEEMILLGLTRLPYTAAILGGMVQPVLPAGSDPSRRISLFRHVPDDILYQMIRHAGIILCRSGYSTLMDLVEVGRTALLVPTPGQPEQEYLADRMHRQHWFYAVPQADFDLERVIKDFQQKKFNKTGIPGTYIRNYLEDLKKLISNFHGV